jgi:hypothetical protein
MPDLPPPAPERANEPGSDELLVKAEGALPTADELVARQEEQVANLRAPEDDEPDDAPDPDDPDEEAHSDGE